MRKLVWITIGFAAACGLCAVVGAWLLLALAAAMLGITVAIVGREWKILQRTALMLLGCALGILWFRIYETNYLDAAKSLHDQTLPVQIRVSDYSWETDYGVAFDGKITIDGKDYDLRVYADAQEPLSPGEILSGTFRFRYTIPDEGEERTANPGKGIFLLAYQADALTRTQAEPSWRDYPARLRRELRTILRTHFPADAYPFAQALLLGDTSELSYAVDTALKISGIRHVAAVSGLHVAILYALLTKLTFRRRFLTALIGIPMLFLFAALAGFTPSVCRACIMCALMQLAMLLNQEYDGPSALAFAVIILLAANPMSITSVSLQLSVASVAGIFLFSPGIQKWMHERIPSRKGQKRRNRMVNGFCASVAVSLSAMTLTTPLCAWYFGSISLVGPLTNLLTLWVISFVFYGILLVCALYPLLPGLAGLLAKLVTVPIRFVLATASVLADAPLSAVYTRNVYMIAWLGFVYILLALFLLSRNRKPMLLACCAVLSLNLSLLALWAEPVGDSLRFTMLDVGQGQCILIQSEGRSFLVDCGGDSETIPADLAAAELLSQGIDHLDALILTHLDRDHAGAAENLLSRMDCDLLILPPVPSDLGKAASGEVLYAAGDLELTYENTVIRIYAANFPGTSNENSLCILFDTENCDILITGDRNGFGERALLRSAALPEVDILVAGHHGSKNSTCEELLTAVSPEIVCISAGKDNSYGHPAPELLTRLYRHGCTVYRTDQSGTILFRR